MPIDFFSKKKLSTFSAVSRWNDVAEKSEAEKRSPEGIHSQVISVGKEPWKKPPTENFIVSFFWKGIKKQPPSPSRYYFCTLLRSTLLQSPAISPSSTPTSNCTLRRIPSSYGKVIYCLLID